LAAVPVQVLITADENPAGALGVGTNATTH
jgi:hypothetical protein